jgi:EF-hand domain pair
MSSRSLLCIMALLPVGLIPFAELAQAQKINLENFIGRCDADHDGAISRDELRKATGARFERLVDKLFEAADKDHDGKLDRKELSLAGESVFWLFETRRQPPTLLMR